LYCLPCSALKLKDGSTVALSRYPDIDVDIYEAATQFTGIGAGIGVWPRVLRILAQLGLDDDLGRVTSLKPSYDLCEQISNALATVDHLSHAADTFIFRKSDQPEGLYFYKLQTQGVSGFSHVHQVQIYIIPQEVF